MSGLNGMRNIQDFCKPIIFHISIEKNFDKVIDIIKERKNIEK